MHDIISVPSGPPQNINCQSRSPNSLLLEWSKPKRKARNGIIRGYWLEYYPRTLWYGKSYHEPILSSDALFVHFPMIGDDFSHRRAMPPPQQYSCYSISHNVFPLSAILKAASLELALLLRLHSGQNLDFLSNIY